MDRKKFLKKGALGFGALAALPLVNGCKKEETDCKVTPSEIAGPFPIKTPNDLIKENIIGDRVGVPLVINITLQNTKDDCAPLQGVYVDLWQCDAKGNYSEYSNQVEGDFTSKHFLRGRQTTNAEGVASFISVYPGWYPGRAPHLHVEILKTDGTSLLTTQIAFPEDISEAVYATSNYGEIMDTKNDQDGSFKDSLVLNMSAVSGNITDGYTLTKAIKVKD
ncbi:MAG: intradiol ring-cleavage dioxygenase [Crocinitomicaceae bacterium]